MAKPIPPRVLISIGEDEAVVELTVDIPFYRPMTKVRILSANQAKRLFEEFEMLGDEGPEGLRPRKDD